MIAAVNGIWLDADAPFLNTVLLCGARFSAALPPIADGAQFSIRTHIRILRALTAFMDERQAVWVKNQMSRRRNIIVAGGTNTGKTTLVNALINEGIPDYNERIAVIEDAAELQIDERRNFIRRLANSKADMKRHVFEILRTRPDRIIVSEVRGPEAFDMVDAMRTGHSGCLSTVHANSAAQAITRIAGLAGVSREIVHEGIQTVLFLERRNDGQRRLAGIEEQPDLEPALRTY
jgi:type IV secretion system protein VirB11